MRRWLFAFAFGLAALFVLPPPTSTQSDDLNQTLRGEYVGKTLLLRGFYSGELLRYDPTGSPIGSVDSDDWTASGFVQISDVRIAGSSLSIKAKRLVVISYDGKQLQFSARDRPHSLRVKADLSGPASLDAANALLSRIFLSAKDSFADLIPDYWKPCVVSALVTIKDPAHTSCSLSPELMSVPGIAPITNSQPPALGGSTSGSAQGVLHPGAGISPPYVLFNPDPRLSHIAEDAGIHGNVVLILTVDSHGDTKDIRIVSPRGAGLDAEAARAVATWKFNPAQKDGHPVPVEIAVQVSFRSF
jgi:TonB family protein